MGQIALQISCLPEDPLEAAARFYAEEVPLVPKLLEQEVAVTGDAVDALTIVFPVSGRLHEGWQLAAVQSLAREFAPVRVNGLTGGDADAVLATTEWLADAPGVTGQLLDVRSS